MSGSRQLQLVTIGLQGSGKTTTCFCLNQLLGGRWLNQDEFASLGRGAKKAFMTTLSEESANPRCPVIIADRINTQRVHRQDVFGAMRTVGIRVVIIWEMSVKDAIDRIKQRKFGHRTIGPDSNAGMIVGRTAKEFEPLSAEEEDMYGIRKVVVIRDPMSFTREAIVKMILAELSDVTGLEFLELNNITDSDIDKAVSKTVQREETISHENEKSLSHKRVKDGKSKLHEVKEGRYEIHFANYADTLTPLSIEFCNTEFVNKTEFHVTLLYINRKLSKILNSSDLMGVRTCPTEDSTNAAELLDVIKSYEKLATKDIPVKLVYIARNDRVMAAKVSIEDPTVRFHDVVPHISLARVNGAEFREANKLVENCDRLRSENFPQGTNGIRWMDLPNGPVIIGRMKFSRHGS